MQSDTPESEAGVRTDYSTDRLFDVLGNEARRVVLFHLRQHGAATFEELVEVLEGLAADDSTPERGHIHAALFHTHLPKLETYDLVAWDRTEDIIRYGSVPAEIGEWLDFAVRRDVAYGPSRSADPEADETCRVLVVDDQPDVAQTIAGWIEHETDDMTVVTATSVLDAVTALESETFDCIVSDYMMPAISGLDFLKAVRAEDPTVPFIVLTAKGSETVASEALREGATDYVPKEPGRESYDELIERIRQAVESSERA